MWELSFPHSFKKSMCKTFWTFFLKLHFFDFGMEIFIEMFENIIFKS